jgi:hypothetical protein
MNLLDLADEELIPIFQRVDHRTKLNLMLTCKRFEDIFGNHVHLIGGSKLAIKRYHLQSPDRVQTLTQMRRHFGTVELNRHDLNLDTDAYNLCFQLLTKIGSKVVKLQISDSQFCFNSLVNLLNLTPNITELRMFGVRMTPKPISSDQIKLVNLRKLKVHNSSRIEIFEKLIKPNFLREIKISGAEYEPHKIFTRSDYSCIPRILSKQQKLVSLELKEISLIDFPESPDWNLDNLQKLVLNKVSYPTPQHFKNFAGFLKKLDKLTDLSLKVESEKIDQLTELFSLPNLTKLKFKFAGFDYKNQLEGMAKLKVRNPGVRELTLLRGVHNQDQCVKIFPNVRKATFDYLDSTSINSWTLLEELELSGVHTNTLSQLKNFRSLKLNSNNEKDAQSWYNFCQHNRQLERLEIGSEDFRFKNLIIITENLSSLKVLILDTISFIRTR